MKEIFDTYIDNAFGEHKQAEFKLEQFEYNYKRFFPENTSAKMLDIGIGRGEMLSCMKKWGYFNYLGIDISPSTVDYCTSLGLNCALVDDTIHWLSNRASFFDVITLLDVLEHFKKEDVIPMLKSLYSATAKNGKIIIQLPNLQAPDAQLHRYNDFTHEIGFTEHSLNQVLSAAGIRNFQFYGFEDLIVLRIRTRLRVFLRSLYWKYCRFLRNLNCNLNPLILHPVFFVVISKGED